METALPQGDTAEAGAVTDASTAVTHDQHAGDQGGDQSHDGEGEGGDKPKPEKTEAEREAARQRRRIDSLTRQKYELQARVNSAPQQQQNSAADDDEPVTMTKAELQRHIAEQARTLAPSMTEQQGLADRRQGVVTTLSKEWGAEKFDAIASDLDDAFGGLADRSGKPRPAIDAIFESDNPKGIIEYLADPDNAEEAERMSAMSATQAGRAIGRLEDKLAADKAKAKPQPSKAAQPIEAARNSGGKAPSMPDPSNTKAYMAWANAQEQAQRK